MSPRLLDDDLRTKSNYTTLAHCIPTPFMLSVARRAKSKHAEGLDSPPFDFAALRSGRTGMDPTGGEKVYESSVVRFSHDFTASVYSSPENRSHAAWRLMPSASPIRVQVIPRPRS